METSLRSAPLNLHSVLKETQLLVEFFIVHHQTTHHDIGMSIHVLRQGVQDQISTEIQRPLIERRGEGVVDENHDLRIVLVNESGDLFDIRQLQQGIGRRLQPDQTRVGFEMFHNRRGISRHIDEGTLHPHLSHTTTREESLSLDRDARSEQTEIIVQCHRRHHRSIRCDHRTSG